VRAAVAAVLLAAFVLWAWQNRSFAAPAPLALPGLPAAWTGWCDSANPGWAAVVLLTSLYYRGRRSAALVLVGAGITVVGHRFGLRSVEPVQGYHVSLLLGTTFALVGFRLGRRV
jgi:hypothetical protein